MAYDGSDGDKKQSALLGAVPRLSPSQLLRTLYRTLWISPLQRAADHGQKTWYATVAYDLFQLTLQQHVRALGIRPTRGEAIWHSLCTGTRGELRTMRDTLSAG